MLQHIHQFYSILSMLERKQGGRQGLDNAQSKSFTKAKGVYFFFEAGEERCGSGTGSRVVRVGTHGLTVGSRSTLWGRLSQHRGPNQGIGNQRGSIFRRHVGDALMTSGQISRVPGWLVGSSSTPDQRAAEKAAELAVSQILRSMEFLWLRIEDEAGPASGRSFIERNSIALLSDPQATALDPPSAHWLGRHARSSQVRSSGLWNINHVGETIDQMFLVRFEKYVREAIA